MALPSENKSPPFKSIGQKLTLMIGATIAVGFISIVYFHTLQQEVNVLLQNERTVRNLTQSVSEGLQTVMITGSADVAEVFAERLKGVSGVKDFRILRLDGVEAFRDNESIKWINEFRGDSDFDLRPTEEAKRQVLSPTDPNLLHAINSQYLVHYYSESAGQKELTFLLPIKSEKRCLRCHGKEKPVIGVLEFTTSLATVDASIRESRLLALVGLALMLVLVLYITRRVLHKAIIKPLEDVSEAMRKVSEGDLSQIIPIVGKDELGRMASSFNKMTSDLRQTYEGFQAERDKLETIVMGSNEGMVVTNHLDEVILVNKAAESLLGKTAEKIISQGILLLLDAPETMQRCFDMPTQDHVPEIMLYNERFLAVYTESIYDDKGALTGKAVLIRDITKEKTLEKMLLLLSNSDALTGLFNRRYLDEALQNEFDRAKTGGRHLSILMFDVDHFKKFNDTYGHDQGDRVLKAFAATTTECVRNLDIACRYGGEEFMVIATETDQLGGVILAERIRTAVAAMRVDGLQVTTSVGVAGLQETQATTPAALADLADQALYRAKELGRNRSVSAEAIL